MARCGPRSRTMRYTSQSSVSSTSHHVRANGGQEAAIRSTLVLHCDAPVLTAAQSWQAGRGASFDGAVMLDTAPWKLETELAGPPSASDDASINLRVEPGRCSGIRLRTLSIRLSQWWGG